MIFCGISLRMIDSNLPLYFALVVIGCACLWQFRRSRGSNHPFAHQNIIIVNTFADSILATGKLEHSSRDKRVVGFDCEWVGRNKVSLLQMSTSDGLCILYRLCKLGKVPLELQSLLEDPSVLKVGVGPVDDAKYLLKDYDVFVRGCVDVRHLVDEPELARGLAKLTSRLLGVELDKSMDVRCSDWEADELTAAQCDYAAQDALAAVKIFDKLTAMKLSRSAMGRLKQYWATPGWDDVLCLCGAYMDVKYKDRKMLANGLPSSSKKVKVTTTGGHQKSPRYNTMMNPLYDNCWILAPDGAQLSTCTKKKVDWYVQNQLGEIVSIDPTCLRLNFEPSSRGFDDRWRYNAQTKVNQCVVCASTDSLVRKNVVPLEYRRHFPVTMTDHTTHDILLLCVACHRRSNTSDMQVRHRLETMSFDGKPHSSNKDGDCRWIKQPGALQVRNAANALLLRSHSIPPHRIAALQEVVKNYFQVPELSDEILHRAHRIEVYELNRDFKMHGQDVIDKFEAGPGLELLQKIWREHFVTTMRPRHLPPLWSVHHSHSDTSATEPLDTLGGPAHP